MLAAARTCSARWAWRTTSSRCSRTCVLRTRARSRTPPCARSASRARAHSFAQLARPAARGNRAFGDYLTSNVFFGALEAAVERHPNITVAQQTAGVDVVVERGRCVQVRLVTLPDVAEGPFQELRGMPVMLHEIGSGSPMFDPRRAMDSQCRALERQLLAAFAVPVELRGVRGGVVLATGGFYLNKKMVARYAPQSVGNMPLGNLGDDGAGIAIALRAGVRLGRMDRCSACKLINPPYSFVGGVLVGGASGRRVRNEDVYGAALADALVRDHGGKGWLVIDQAMWDEAQADCLDPALGAGCRQEGQLLQGLANLHKNHVKAESLAELADEAGMDRAAFLDTMREYNDDAARKEDRSHCSGAV
jgi:3-oxo-5alpha-steroid 4-dehydrogenase